MTKIKVKVKKGDIPKHRNFELNQSLITCGYRVVPDKRKNKNKYACRNNQKFI